MAATHSLESQGQALLAGLKYCKAHQPLTNWRAKDRHCQQAWNTARHSSHSLPEEPWIGIISRLKILQSTAATHQLKSREQALLAGLKHCKTQQPLTSWRAKDRHCQQAWNTIRAVTTHILDSKVPACLSQWIWTVGVVAGAHHLQLRDIKLMRHVQHVKTVTTCPDKWKQMKRILNYTLFISDLYSRTGIGTATLLRLLLALPIQLAHSLVQSTFNTHFHIAPLRS